MLFKLEDLGLALVWEKKELSERRKGDKAKAKLACQFGIG
jgi:hypothetical protein